MRLGVEAALIEGLRVAGDVEVRDGLVAAAGLAGGRPGRLAAPGLVDLQVNGFAGVDLARADPAGYARAGAALQTRGTTAYLPTFVTAPEPELLASLRGMPLDAPGARILGAHLEGPFLAPARLGAHPAADRRDPDLSLLRRLLDGAPVRLVTLAPELPGAGALIDELAGRGIVASAGHSGASAAEAHAAFDRGVRAVTHLHNAMDAGTAREPGLATVALAREDVTVMAIADGHHLAPDTLRLAWRAAGGRLALVSDAVAAAGAADGAYTLGGRAVHAAGGVVRTAGGRLAGSAATLLDGVHALHALGVPLETALGAASSVPARLIGRPALGVLRVGGPADVLVLDDRLEAERVLVGGED